MIMSKFRELLLRPYINRVVRRYRQVEIDRREHQENTLPKVPLNPEHIAHLKPVLNRSALLDVLPKDAVVAEIGVAQGRFSREILEVSKPCELHLIDLWHSERYNDGLFKGVLDKFNVEIEEERVKVHRCNSVDAAELFPDGYFDWIYIDTDHGYEVTSQELLAYAAKVKEGGFIAGHDYVIGNWRKGIRYGVIEAVHEFCVLRGWALENLTIDAIEIQSFAIRKIKNSH